VRDMAGAELGCSQDYDQDGIFGSAPEDVPFQEGKTPVRRLSRGHPTGRV